MRLKHRLSRHNRKLGCRRSVRRSQDSRDLLAWKCPGNDDERLALCDEFIRWWHREPAEQRIDRNIIVNLAGVTIGDVLAGECGLTWKIISDEFGTDLGLWREEGQIVVSPIHSVAKLFADEQDGFVVDLCASLRAKLRGIGSGDWT
jgi:Domain of unknown function (DUF3806)